MSRARVAFLCRGSVDDGLGHVIRTAVVAKAAMRDLDVQLYVVGDETAERILGGYGLPVRTVASDGDLVELTDRFRPDAVVLDMVALGRAPFERLAHNRLTVSLSPIFSGLDEVDLAFSRTRYGAGDAIVDDPDRGRYAGLEYAVVRPDCRRIDTGTFARHLDEPDISIAVSMGGADAPNRTLSLLTALRGLKAPAVFWTILGEGYGHSYRELVDCVRRDTRHEIILAKTNRSMWRTLANCSLAILAGGVTTYEAAHAGLPTVNVLTSPDRRFLIRELVERRVAYLGGVQANGIDGLVEMIDELAADREQLLLAHRASREIIDGRGAARIAALIATRLGVTASKPVAVG